MIAISVIIPTYCKNEILEMALNALGKQTLPSIKFEVIIIDDGSGTRSVARANRFVKKLKYPVKFIRQAHQGPAAARNKGIKAARGELVLIINDDTIPDPDLLSRHANFHRDNPRENFSLLGFVTWHPSLEITPFMTWLEHGGPYFSFNEIKGKEAGWERLWTCNVSFKRKFLLENGLFDEDFPYAAWEDVELGYRLSKKKLRLFYDKKAIGYHYHPTTIRSIKNKMIANGISALIMKKKLPPQVLPPIAKTPITQLAIFFDLFFSPLVFLFEQMALFAEKRFICPPLFMIVLLHYRIVGLRKAV